MGLFEPKKAVDLFMIISGFLMFYSIDKSAEKQSVYKWATWRSFYIRRFLRISPMYYLALAVVLISWPVMSAGITALQDRNPAFWNAAPAYLPANQDLSLGSIMLHLTYLFGLFPTLSFSTQLPDWSLSLEMQFYAALPIIYLLSVRLGMPVTSVFLTVGALGATKAINILAERGQLPAFEEPSLLVFKLPVFLLGAMLYRSAIDRRPINYIVTAVVLIASFRQYRFDGLLLFALVAAFGFCAFCRQARPLQPLMTSAVAKFLTHTSFSAYLIHGLAIAFVGPGFLSWADRSMPGGLVTPSFAVIVTLITYPLSYLLYRTVELWGIRLAKRITGRAMPVASPMA